MGSLAALAVLLAAGVLRAPGALAQSLGPSMAAATALGLVAMGVTALRLRDDLRRAVSPLVRPEDFTGDRASAATATLHLVVLLAAVFALGALAGLALASAWSAAGQPQVRSAAPGVAAAIAALAGLVGVVRRDAGGGLRARLLESLGFCLPGGILAGILWLVA